ncbi:NAD(P)/FAD-dependent oxidoreductase [Aquibacillus sediminis]|uniref:NAD(P)/FAD-dependent oxidoreductase n=1 Tax=Aquibacillus sediminis TaxID=2574734 RepID=UPI001109CE10|nr:NAD(P)/FAD-dependent oxidoreductase [Aquibacillus sediminis]
MKTNNDLYDVVIIGGGTTGLFAAQYSRMRGLTTKLIEAKPALGGKVAQFFPEKYIYDIGAIPDIRGNALITQMVQQANKHQPTIVKNEWVKAVHKSGGKFELITDNTTHDAKTIIIATGMGSFEVASTQLDVNLHTYCNVHMTLQDLDQFKNKEIVIVSNNRVGLDWALTLEPITKKVYLINNRESFQHASEHELKKLWSSSIELRINAQVNNIDGNKEQVNCIDITTSSNEQESVRVEHLLVYDGVKLHAAPFQQWALGTEKGRVHVDSAMATNVEGIYAAGDATIYPNKTMLIASGYAEAITAVNSAKKYIDPSSSNQVYSTVIYK